MKNLVDKLTMYASLVGVVTAIGGGFYAWGEFNTRLSAIEGSNVDVSGITKNAEDIAVISEKIGNLESKSVDTSGIGKNAEAIAEVDKKATVNEKTLSLFKLEIEELKLKAKNPLAN